ncbi:hypothetical protein F5J12DRAFT_785820 [Pisolithus orientalis]|uniref:uncharacterized protein n=1 Tax=Pisolithus orientalis TaxID=936130 RepID=UPI00222481AA|nr:uncharacterized protein F5J12DRAFT_785818 [Pisolithus orientalis]XP_051596086.1 uncharacterized protein F5J12DRAFT_785820 [Pisolithus orientalis]KAI5994255.1 hypothetical protein F5J12DRAFT_785818 [Pisolithus orientalis]KAI5994259.1 hypothetical protein F5J12DRAFT_785820 [Pisolithus orientalis]
MTSLRVELSGVGWNMDRGPWRGVEMCQEGQRSMGMHQKRAEKHRNMSEEGRCIYDYLKEHVPYFIDLIKKKSGETALLMWEPMIAAYAAPHPDKKLVNAPVNVKSSKDRLGFDHAELTWLLCEEPAGFASRCNCVNNITDWMPQLKCKHSMMFSTGEQSSPLTDCDSQQGRKATTSRPSKMTKEGHGKHSNKSKDKSKVPTKETITKRSSLWASKKK